MIEIGASEKLNRQELKSLVVTGNLNFADLTTLNLVFNDTGSTANWANSFWGVDQTWTLFNVAGNTAASRSMLFVRISLDDRDVPSFDKSLEHLLRYCARPAFAVHRRSVISGHGWTCRLESSHGVFAPNHPLRPRVTAMAFRTRPTSVQ